MWYIYTLECYSSIKRMKSCHLQTTRWDLEGTTLSKMGQRQILYDLTYMLNIKNKLVNITRNRLAGTKNKLVVTKGDRGGGRGKIGVEDQEIQTTRHKINQLQGCTVQHRKYGYFIYNHKLTITFKNCASLCCISETDTILCINYTTIEKEKWDRCSSTSGNEGLWFWSCFCWELGKLRQNKEMCLFEGTGKLSKLWGFHS